MEDIMAIPVYKQHQQNRSSNIAYIRADIFDVILSKINGKQSSGNILIPECYGLDSRDDSKFSQKLFELFPQLKANLDMYRTNTKNYGSVQFIDIPNVNGKNFGKIIFANMICKMKSKTRSLYYIALAKTMVSVSNYLTSIKKDELENIDIIATKFGSGRSGGDWHFIEKLIEDAWFNHNIQIYYGKN